jgi:hypothetical protein
VLADQTRSSGLRHGRAALAALVAGVALTSASWFALGCSSGPVADGPTLLQERCAKCHSPNRGLTSGKTADEWNTTISRMVEKGAQLNRAEKAVLVAHLASITKPK